MDGGRHRTGPHGATHTTHVGRAVPGSINEAGVTILLVEQNVAAALNVARRAYVLEKGRVVKSGPATELRQHDQVRRAYLGM